MSRPLATVSIILIAMAVLAQQGVEIVRDGEPLATIVLADEAPAQVAEAAEMLASYVEQSSGALLPVANEAPADAVSIHIGHTARAEAAGINQSDLDGDGFDIVFPDSSTIIIPGAGPWGTEFGVCEFLARYVGVRWVMPGPDGNTRACPRHDRGTEGAGAIGAGVLLTEDERTARAGTDRVGAAQPHARPRAVPPQSAGPL